MENTTIRCYLNLVHETDFMLDYKAKIENYLINVGIKNFKFVFTKVDCGIELFDSGKIDSLFVDEVMDELLNQLRFHNDSFKDFFAQFHFIVKKIDVVINIYEENLPSIYISKNALEILNTLGIEIEFDMYSF